MYHLRRLFPLVTFDFVQTQHSWILTTRGRSALCFRHCPRRRGGNGRSCLAAPIAAGAKARSNSKTKKKKTASFIQQRIGKHPQPRTTPGCRSWQPPNGAAARTHTVVTVSRRRLPVAEMVTTSKTEVRREKGQRDGGRGHGGASSSSSSTERNELARTTKQGPTLLYLIP